MKTGDILLVSSKGFLPKAIQRFQQPIKFITGKWIGGKTDKRFICGEWVMFCYNRLRGYFPEWEKGAPVDIFKSKRFEAIEI